jgi:F0F1-type ATP synthase membrane subunit b/b'
MMLALFTFWLLSVYWARAAYIAQQRLNEAKAAKASTAQLQEAYDRAKRAAEEAAAKLGQALKAEADAKRAVEREKQREMLKDMKEKNKADKEKQKQVG